MGFEETLRPNKSSNLPGYTGYCPRLRFKCGRTYGSETDRLTKLYTKNEKLNPNNALNPTSTPLPLATGDNKLTASMLPGYTGYVPIHTPGFIYGSTYKESTETALKKFLENVERKRSEQRSLSRTAIHKQSLREREDYCKPATYPEINVAYSKNYTVTDRKSFMESPVSGYTGFIPNFERFALGQRYHKWTKEGLQESVQSRLRNQHLLTKRVVLVTPDLTTSKRPFSSGDAPSVHVLYNNAGMLPKYTGYIPTARYRFGKTYGNTTREVPACTDPQGYATGKYITFPMM
ncbi:protein FAM166B-like [Xenia sp. Carnegie-2017]|uniref:protein FAM166B-like n=1 Tax=Xenia sp. Carnegie-2017 TaxID=2897299 RepID=UPI001F03403E|nr:protein FAM166B-like [Xenia sp. Carnegie-2017]